MRQVSFEPDPVDNLGTIIRNPELNWRVSHHDEKPEK